MNRWINITSWVIFTAFVTDIAAASDRDSRHSCFHGKLEAAGYHATKAYDESTGRDLRNFPPDRVVDYLHMKLQMWFDDLNEMRFRATETLTFIPIAKECTGLTLNAVGLNIQTVRLGEQEVEYSQDDNHLMLRFDPPLSLEREHQLVIEYECVEPYDGLFFTPTSPDAPHYTAEVHTQGQTESNSHWFVCHDFPNEQLTTEIIVDVPAGYSVSSNGKLVSSLTSGDRAVWHWLQDKPHVTYLVSLIIGKFDIIDIPHDSVPMKVWAPVGLSEQVMQTYGRTGDMIDVFEDRFGLAYPWDRYDQLIVKNFRAGGMENTAATTMYPTAIFDKTSLLDNDMDSLIAHELCHQWTGDLITCKSWEHIWLNEGWATFGSALWFEARDGEKGYLDFIHRSFNRVTARDKTTNEIPMVSPVYDKSWEVFRRKANPYPKGCSILHMLRMMLGEDVFWNGVQTYMNRFSPGLVETSDFRYVMEEVSGQGLEWFFEQWCYRPGVPELEITVKYDGQSRELLIDVEQAQEINERTPAFRFTLPINVRVNNGNKTFNIEVEEQSTSFQTILDGPPFVVAIDPYLSVLKTLDVEKPLKLWIEQAKSGPTIASRHQAIKALAETDSPDTIALLATIIRDENERFTLRRTAVGSLAEYSSKKARETLLAIATEGVPEAKVRVTLVEKLRDLDKDKVVELLAKFADTDASYAVREAAIDGLAEIEANEKADLIAELVHFESQHQDVRRAALKALGELDEKQGLDLAIQYSAYGNMDRARADAVGVIGQLAHHDADRAVPYLIGLLDDVEWRTVFEAGEALVEAADERGVEPIEAMVESHRNPEVRERAEEWLEKLNKKLDEDEDNEEDEDDD